VRSGASEQINKPNYMTPLDTLRAFAVAGVAWYHWAPPNLQFGIPWYVGVDLFFVISGFLITGILLDCRWPQDTAENPQRRFSLRQFYIRRFLRIFPLYYMVLLGLFLWDMKPVRETIFWHLFYGSNFYILNHGWLGPLSHFWSLSVEEQFYIFWPLLILFAPHKRLAPLVAGIILIAPLFRIFVPLFWPSLKLAHILVFGYLDSLGMGAMLAFVWRGKISSQVAVWLIGHRKKILWISLLGYLFTHFMGPMAWKPIRWIEAFGSTFLALLFICVIHSVAGGVAGVWGKVLRFRPFLYLGKISYGLYIFHNIPVLATILSTTPGFWGVYAIVPARIALQTVSTIAISMLSWHLLESPINSLKRKFPYVSK
jgi:peptidoglycan/LPS O-acetylase OafA/YrhL